MISVDTRRFSDLNVDMAAIAMSESADPCFRSA